MVGPTAQYWTDMLQANPGGYAVPGFCQIPNNNASTALQAAFNLFSCFANNETTAVQVLDQGGLTDPVSGNPIYAVGGPYSFVDPQFAALGTHSVDSELEALKKERQKPFLPKELPAAGA